MKTKTTKFENQLHCYFCKLETNYLKLFSLSNGKILYRCLMLSCEEKEQKLIKLSEKISYIRNIKENKCIFLTHSLEFCSKENVNIDVRFCNKHIIKECYLCESKSVGECPEINCLKNYCNDCGPCHGG